MKPLISIIIPVYNRLEVLKDTLDSILKQEYQNWECIVIDDGSSDGSQKFINYYCKKDSRFKLYSRPKIKKKGASSCRNYGFEKSKGELIQYLDSDDIMHSKKLIVQVAHYTCNTSLSLFTCRWGGFTNKEDLRSRFKYKYHAYQNFKRSISLLNIFGLYNEFFPPHVYLSPRKLIEKAGEWNEDLSNNDDAEFFTRIIINASEILFTENAKVYYRYGNSGKLSNLDSENKIESLLASWKLIEDHISVKYGGKNNFYVANAKRNISLLLKNKYPIIMKRELSFLNSKSRVFDFFKFFSNIKSINRYQF